MNMKKFQRGFTLIEIIIGIAVIGVMGAITVPSGMTAYHKAQSNNLSKEFDIVQNSVLELRSMKKSHIPTVKLISPKGEVTSSVLHSCAFTETCYPGQNYLESLSPKNRPPIAIHSNIHGLSVWVSPYYRDNAQIKNVNSDESPQDFYSNTQDVLNIGWMSLRTPELAENVSSTTINTWGNKPIFDILDAKTLEDFIDSPKGLNLKDFRVKFKDDLTDVDLLSIIFGGTNYHTLEQVFFDGTEKQMKGAITLTQADTYAIRTLMGAQSVKVLTDTSNGKLFFVTEMMSWNNFLKYMYTERYSKIPAYQLFDSPNSRVIKELYDILYDGFSVDTPVYIPYRKGTHVKYSGSDLKYDYYRP